DLLPRSRGRPLLDAGVERGIVARPLGVADKRAEELPLRFGPNTQGDPAIVARTAIHAMRSRDRVAVAVASRKTPVRCVLEQRRRHELESRLVLREIDDAAFAGTAAPLRSEEHTSELQSRS